MMSKKSNSTPTFSAPIHVNSWVRLHSLSRLDEVFLTSDNFNDRTGETLQVVFNNFTPI